MHGMRKRINELHAMLKLHEQTLTKKDPALHAIRAGKVQKKNNKQKKSQLPARGQNQGKGKNKLAYAPKPKIPPPPKRKNPSKDSVCHQCGDTCHWKRNVLISRNNLVYFSVVPRDGIFEIDLSDSNTNDSSMYAVSKKSRLNLDSSLLWHCRLGHINKKRIEKLQHDRLLNSTDLRDFEKCASCMSRKMARKPYIHQVERAKDLLGLIHTDVCGPIRTMSRQGASHIITFTNDFSRYGYVYLLKHKHEMFETFKVFQKEVENKLEKTIKSLRSDRGGDKNRTLLDMVRFIMSQITLPKSFWDYALETAAFILNMVPTKKVEKTSYEDTIGYSFYYPLENKVLVARNAEFLENSLITQEASESLEDLKNIQEEDTHPSINTSSHHEEDDLEINEPQSDIIPILRSTRAPHALDRMCLYIDVEEHELGDLGEPANYKAALLDPKYDKWLDAINMEMQSMKDNEVWDLVDLPYNGKIVARKWLFQKKTDMDGAVHTFKAHIRAIRILIAIAAFYDYEIWQMDAKTAFLNGHLSEEVYMEQPEGFVNPKYLNRVCKLKRSIYGLKKATRQWNKRFDDEIKKFSFTQNRDEPCVYLKASGSNVTFLILYVDDILIMRNNIPMLQDGKSYLGRCFAIKDLGEAAYILGIKIYRDRSRRLIGLCQSAYIEKILKRFYMENSKHGSIPMQEKLRLSKSQGASTPAELKRMQNVPYASTVGSIMYAVRCTCPDVAFVQNITSRFQQNSGAVDWKSTKQSIFATSSAEAEYIAAYDAFKESVWVRKFISRWVLFPQLKKSIKMYCDNIGAITIANESEVTKGARHFHAKVYYLREVIEYDDIKLEKVHTDDNLADPFTKALAFPKHSGHTKNIGMLLAISLM
uniref:Retrotransposon protein, putative, Ty1-copia subclass n=1 Tax=Tanacetum cinerariifolium TaxID=118510 RepID=A0A6L2J7R4_TANCI|nr:hypothetical protein [Tanacetum cinerariifolium]